MRTFGWLLLAAGCLPEVASDLARVDEPRILAVRAEPAEAAPGEAATLTALYADADGELSAAPLDWAFCVARRPLAELGPVNRRCLAAEGDALIAIGEGLEVTTTLPEDGCRLFGPDPPPAQADQPAGRVVDPDLSGGYYQPIRVQPPGADAEQTLLLLRIRCGLAGATQQQSAEHRRRYKPNVAPAVTLAVDGAALEGLQVHAGEEVALRARWAACPSAPACGDGVCSLDEDGDSCAQDCGETSGCAGAETYLIFDPTTLQLATRREAIGAAWYATGGSFAAARTGRAPEDLDAFSDNTWTAPDVAGSYALWVVLRDDRGGVAWHRADVTVTP